MSRLLKRYSFILAPLALYLGVIAIALSAIRFDPTSFACSHLGDFNVIGLAVEKAKDFSVFVGPYSRHHFFHPGPFFFYLYAAADSLLTIFPPGFPRFSVIQALINLSMLLIVQFIIARDLRAPIISWITIYLAFIIFPFTTPGFLSEIWGPTTLLCPMLAYLVCAAVLTTGRLSVLLPFTISASLMMSNHLGSVTVVVPIAIFALVLCFLSRRGASTLSISASDLRQIALASLALLVFWSLPVIDALTKPNWGNVGAILHYVSTRAGANPLESAVSYVAGFANAPFASLIGDSLNVRLISLTILVVLPFLLPRGRVPAAAALRQVVTAAYLLSIYAAARITGEMHSYILYFVYAIVVLSLCLILIGISQVSLIARARERLVSLLLYRTMQPTGNYSGWLSSALVLCVTYSVFSTVPSSFLGPCTVPNPHSNLVRSLALDPNKIYRVTGRKNGNISWEPLSRAVYAVTANGFKACVDQRWGFIFGADATCRVMAKAHGVKRVSSLELLTVDRATPEDLKIGVVADDMRAGRILALVKEPT